MDRPVFALEQVPHHAYIVCVLNARPMTALKRLLHAGYDKVLNYADLCRVCADVPLPDFSDIPVRICGTMPGADPPWRLAWPMRFPAVP